RARRSQPADRPGDHDQRPPRAHLQAEPGLEERPQRLVLRTTTHANGEAPDTDRRLGAPGQALLQDRRSGAAVRGQALRAAILGDGVQVGAAAEDAVAAAALPQARRRAAPEDPAPAVREAL